MNDRSAAATRLITLTLAARRVQAARLRARAFGRWSETARAERLTASVERVRDLVLGTSPLRDPRSPELAVFPLKREPACD